MAATVSAWSKPGAWALDSEEHEQELIQESAAAAKVQSNSGDTADFPSLAAAASTKTKKKKPQTLSLSEFYTADSKKFQAGGGNKGLTVNEQLMLPTGPRQRTAEEMDRTRLGGGFRSYGSNDRSESSRWGSDRSDEDRGRQGGFGRDRDSNREVAPSRADEIDDWGAAKKSSIGGGFERRERGERGERGGFFSDSQSRADDSDSWVSNKSFTPSTDGGRRYGGGFDRERRGGGFESSGNGNGADSDNWGRKKEEDGRRFGAGGGAFDSLRERRGGNEMNGGGGATDSEAWGKRREDGIGSGIGSGRPKLNLQPRKLPVGESEGATATVKSSTGSNPFGDARPREQVLKEKVPVGESEGATATVKSSKGSNPFGDARPREQVLKEKGQDWKEIDEKLESMKIKEADGPTVGKRGFGSGNAWVGVTEERSWRKNETVDPRPPSAQNSESGVTEETEERDPEV